jgi:2-phospho-L-lactate/phosphoenolpyruvate guanylyltransferase
MPSQPPGPPSPGLAPLHVLLPLRTLTGGKARLGEALDPEERVELVLGLLLHALDVVAAWGQAEAVHVVSPDATVASVMRAAGCAVSVHRQSGEGLNAGVAIGVAEAMARGAASLLVLPTDLPYLSGDALSELVVAADAGLAAAAGGPLVAIAPSDARGGTNALLLHPPDVIAPCFGNDSLEAHLRAAQEAGAAVQLVGLPDLGFDLDTPEDLERLDPGRLRELTGAGRRHADGVGA